MATLPPHGLFLGWTSPIRAGLFRQPVWDDGSEGHLMTIAPTGAGKGVSCSIPALLSWRGPAIVVDPKGEHYAVSARHRRALGQKVYVLDPFRVTGAKSTDSLNPLDLLRGPQDVDNATVLATLIAQQNALSSEPFWDERACALISEAILFTARHLNSVEFSLLSVARLLSALSKRPPYPNIFSAAVTNVFDSLAAAFQPTGVGVERTAASIYATACSHTSFLTPGPVEHSLRTSTLRLGDITNGAPLTVYLVIPPDRLQSHSRLLRLWLGVILTVLCRRRFRPSKPTLLLIDEASQLGELKPLRTALTLLRSYGVRVWTFWQDLSQLSTTYRDWHSLINNSAVLQQFGVPSPLAAMHLKELYGDFLPKPVYAVEPTEMILTRTGTKPTVVTRCLYYRDPPFMGLFDPHPLLQRPPHPASHVPPLPFR